MGEVDEEKITFRNRPSPEGRMLGEQLGRLTDKTEAELRKKFPGHAERCGTCAFRGGTVPNGCPSTLMDALKCVVEVVPFYCHEKFKDGKPTDYCNGWMIALSSGIEKNTELKASIMPWEFTTDPQEPK